MQSFFSHGKLLITGEYAVLDAALSLAVPTKLGQRMEVKPIANTPGTLVWNAYNNEGVLWYSEHFKVVDNKVKPEFIDACNINPTTTDLTLLLNQTIILEPSLLSEKSFEVNTFLEFPNNWGLGSSSTLICNLAKWAQIDAFELSAASFGGSGYDVAVGMLGGDILYRSPEMWEGYVFNPSFKDKLYFVHLNKKQNSRDGIKAYRSKPENKSLVYSISEITEQLIQTPSLDEFARLLNQHESLISSHLDIEPIKQQLFSDYPNTIKSLGAWGGDFVLACGDEKTPDYFKAKGYHTVLSFNEMVK